MRHFFKKGMAALLSAVMVVTGVPQFAKEVHAAENQLPTKDQFATVDELKSFNTNNQDGKNPAKVYFGNNDQQWWIAGSQQEQGLTLFAASPLATGQQFEPNQYEKEYNGQSVYSNHYGASDIKKTVNGLETSYFTGTEQGLMNDTTIYTSDTKNSSVYSTTDKLYLAYGDYNDDEHITVGTNSQDSLNNGLRVDRGYWGNSTFWLRAPSMDNSNNALVANPGGFVLHFNVYDDFALVPAFELNLTSVIFASAAPAATSEGTLATNDAFTLRQKSQTDIGTATISQSKGSIAVTDVTNENTYLVVQNSRGAWSKKVSSNDVVFASDIDSSLTSFENCKVWLETTSDRITYAEEATQGSGHNVKVNIGENLTVNDGNILQTNVSGNITEITIKVNDGYYLPDDYTDTIQGLNGLNVKDITQTGFTISGTPTSDVNITLPAATVLPKSETPEVTISKTKASITATVTNHKAEFGDIEYKWNDGNWEKNKNTLSNLNPDTTYKLAVRFTGNGFYQPSDEYSEDITTLKDGNTVIVVPTGLTTTYKEGLKLSEVVLPADSGWSWVNGDTKLSAGIASYLATFDTTALESTHDFSGVEGYDTNTHKVTRKVEVKVNKADSSISITNTIDKAYDGQVVSKPEYTTSGSDGKVTILWQENQNGQWEDLTSAPSTVGSYRVVVELAGNDNYNSASTTLDFVISQATNTWTEELSITGWTYNDKVNAPVAKAQFGDVTFTYSSEENGTYTNEVPKNAGTWYVKATVAGTANYTGLESAPVSFEIKKADSFIKFKDDVALDKVYDGKAVSAPEYTTSGSNGKVTIKWQEKSTTAKAEWEDLDKAPSKVGSYRVAVELAGNDNYNSASATLEFAITKSDSDIQVTLDKSEYTYGDMLTFNIDVDLKSDSNLSTKLLQQDTVALYLGEQKLSDDVKLEDKKAVITFDTTKTDQLGELDREFTFTIKYEGDNNLNVSNKDITVPVHKKRTEITNINDLSKTYDGKEISELTYDINHKESKVEVTYQQLIGDKYEDIQTPVVNAGGYQVILTSPATNHYSACKVAKKFEITSSDSDITITSDKDAYVYEDKITLDVSVDLAKKQSFFERLFTNDNTVTAYIGDTAISSPVELDKNNHAELTIHTKDENVRKVLKPSDQKQTITVKYNGSENLNNTKENISIMLSKKDTTVSFKDSAFNLSRVYNGETVTVDVEKDVQKTEDAPEVTLNWKTEDGTALNTAPSKAGKYQLVVSIPEDAYYRGSSVEHNFEISKAELSVEVKVKDKPYDGLNTAEIETATLTGVVEVDKDKITLINGIPTFDSVEAGENITIHFTEFALEADENVLNNYTLIQPTGVTANITNTWIPQKNTEYTTSKPNENGWLKEDFKVQAKEGYLLALGNKADGSRSTNWKKELAGSEKGANSIEFYMKDEKTGAISTKVTENYQLDKIEPEVQGLEKDKIYCKEVTFTVKETNLDVVKANEKELTPNEKGVYTLNAGSYQITAVDQAGNEAVLAVTVNAEHTPNADDGDCTTPIYCTVCGEVVKEAQEHSFTTYTSNSDAGCLTDGTKTAKCDHEGCKQTKIVVDEGSALGHDWGEWETVTSPDCENKGSKKRTCKRCQVTETEELDPNGHDWEEDFTVDQEATCTQEGSKSIHCKNCDAVKDSTVIPATGHAYGEPKWNWNEDGKAATATFTCQNDSSHVTTKNAEVTSAVKEPATCTQEGTTTYTATVSFEGNVLYTDAKDVTDIAALGHDWEEEYTIDKAASCTEEGSKSIHCKNCAETKNSTAIPATGHAYGEPKWSWNEDEKTATATFICQNDNSHVETKAAEVTSAVKEPATCTKEGTVTYTAKLTFEGNVYTDTKDSKEIPVTGHKYVHGVCTVCAGKAPDYQAHEVGGGSGVTKHFI